MSAERSSYRRARSYRLRYLLRRFQARIRITSIFQNSSYSAETHHNSEQCTHQTLLEMDAYREESDSDWGEPTYFRSNWSTNEHSTIRETDSDWDDTPYCRSPVNWSTEDSAIRETDSDWDDTPYRLSPVNWSTEDSAIRESVSEWRDPRYFRSNWTTDEHPTVRETDSDWDDTPHSRSPGNWNTEDSATRESDWYDSPHFLGNFRIEDHTTIRESDSDGDDTALFRTFGNLSIGGHSPIRVSSLGPELNVTQRRFPRETSVQDDFQVDEIYDPDFEDPRLFQFICDDTETSTTTPTTDTSIRPPVAENCLEKHLWPCVGCVEKPPEILFTPCLHSVCCKECANQVKDHGGCPVCSSAIDVMDHIYFTEVTCVVCMDSPPEVAFKPCCHAVCCKECAETIVRGGYNIAIERKCPVCKAYIVEKHEFRLAYN